MGQAKRRGTFEQRKAQAVAVINEPVKTIQPRSKPHLNVGVIGCKPNHSMLMLASLIAATALPKK